MNLRKLETREDQRIKTHARLAVVESKKMEIGIATSGDGQMFKLPGDVGAPFTTGQELPTLPDMEGG